MNMLLGHVKTTRPTTASVLPRPRLFHSLELAANKPLVWVSGPAGSGKDTAYLAGTFTGLFAIDDPTQIDPGRYSARYDNYSVTSLVPVALDINPASCPNRLDVRSTRVLPVAILGSSDFDVTRIDPRSLRLLVAPAHKKKIAPRRWALKDVATPYEPYLGKIGRSDCTGDGPDGYTDLTLKFNLRSVARYLHRTKHRTAIVVSIVGKLKPEFGGGAITGEDVVFISNPNGM